jgi:hypothetical protein
MMVWKELWRASGMARDAYMAKKAESELCKVRFSRNEAGMSFRINKTLLSRPE